MKPSKRFIDNAPRAASLPMAGIAALVIACGSGGPSESASNPNAAVAAKQSTPRKVTPAEEVALGKKLVATSGCHDCHTPFKMGPKGPEPDMSRSLSGHPESLVMPPAPPPQGPWLIAVAGTNTAWAGPWGVSFTANLTPDPQTGLGKWKKEHFVQTIRTGRHMGRGRPVLPPMPVPVYQNFSDEELGAIFSYLQTLEPIANRVPDPVPPGTTAALSPAPAEPTTAL